MTSHSSSVSEENILARWFELLSQGRTNSFHPSTETNQAVSDVLTVDNHFVPIVTTSTQTATTETRKSSPPSSSFLNMSEYIGQLVFQQERIDSDELQIHQQIISHQSEFVKFYKNVEWTVIQQLSKFYGIQKNQQEQALELSTLQYLNLQEMRDLASDKRGPTLLHRACQYNYPNLVAFLIRYGGGADAFSVLDNNLSTPLHYACMSGAFKAVTVLLSLHRSLCITSKIDIISMKDTFGNTPLHLAMQNSHFEILQTLIDYQPQCINLKKTGNSQSLLHIAVENFNVKGLKLILEQNSHRNPILHSLDQLKCTPLLYAIKCYSKDEKEEQVAKWTRASSSSGTAVVVQVSPVSTLNSPSRLFPSWDIENSPNLESQNFSLEGLLLDEQDKSPKNKHQHWNRLYFLSYLISKEIEYSSNHSKNSNLSITNSSNSQKEQPSLLTTHDNNLPETLPMDTFSKLHLSSQTDVNKRNCFHLAALHDCCDFIRIFTLMAGYGEISELMIAQDFEGDTPFHIACRTGQVQIVEIFLQIFEIFREVNVDSWNDFNNLSQMRQQQQQNLKNQMQDSSSIDSTFMFFQIKNRKGETPLHSAVSSLIEVHQHLKNASKSKNTSSELLQQKQLNGDLLTVKGTSPYNAANKGTKSFLQISHKHKKQNLRKIISKLWEDSRVDIHSKNNSGRSIYESLRDFTDFFQKTNISQVNNSMTKTTTPTTSTTTLTSPSSLMMLSGTRSSTKFFSKPLFSFFSDSTPSKSATTTTTTTSRSMNSLLDRASSQSTAPSSPRRRTNVSFNSVFM
ncbi:hypothetical protein C9374_010545 [Naegleria lovaniensis]|uniref:Uncharacterized protein n=1 Tax=Naegleria lovaniensis TaxID=51637 RepID=A0AA88GE07_NAELO|nr:uncharacterized protein C9374_010545 [Naegleria lovaniensis]KAG2374801.1 hypothetical protein C9374_010545 [Naegleria lovaniensis]